MQNVILLANTELVFPRCCHLRQDYFLHLIEEGWGGGGGGVGGWAIRLDATLARGKAFLSTVQQPKQLRVNRKGSPKVSYPNRFFLK